MVRFIKKILVFTFLLISSFLLFNYVSYTSENYILNTANNKVFSLDKNKNILLLGDSNMQCAINDSIFKSSINKAASSDSYFYSYLKLKKFTSVNSEIDTVLLSFAPHNIFDNGWLDNKSHINSRYAHYYYLMDWRDYKFLFTRNPEAVISSSSSNLKTSIEKKIKKALGRNTKQPYSYGGFLGLERDMLEDHRSKLKKDEILPFFHMPENFNVSTGEITYLNKIIEFCKKNNIAIYLINLPKTKDLLDYPKYGVSHFNKIYEEKYSNINYLDFSKFIMPDDHYADLVHLNKKGSSYFSTFLNQSILNELEKKTKNINK